MNKIDSIYCLGGFLMTHFVKGYPKAQKVALDKLNDIEVDSSEEQKLKDTISWFIQKRWGSIKDEIELEELVYSLAEGDFHFEEFEGETKICEMKVEPLKTSNNLQARVGSQFANLIGHTVKGKGSGYISPYVPSEKNEQIWSHGLGLSVASHLRAAGMFAPVMTRQNGSYGAHVEASKRWIDKETPSAFACAEYHWNAATPQAHGFEIIVYSKAAEEIAKPIAASIIKEFPNLTPRDFDGVRVKRKGRGIGLLKAVRPPAMIFEWFFASNEKEAIFMDKNKDKLAFAVARGIVNSSNIYG